MPGPTVWELVQLLQKLQLATQLDMLHYCNSTGIFSPRILPPEDQPAKELQPLGKAARKAMNRRLGFQIDLGCIDNTRPDWNTQTRLKHSGTSFALKFRRLRREKEEAEYALEGCGKWLELKNQSSKTSSLDNQVLIVFHCSCLYKIAIYYQCFFMRWNWIEPTSPLFVCSEASVAL